MDFGPKNLLAKTNSHGVSDSSRSSHALSAAQMPSKHSADCPSPEAKHGRQMARHNLPLREPKKNMIDNHQHIYLFFLLIDNL